MSDSTPPTQTKTANETLPPTSDGGGSSNSAIHHHAEPLNHAGATPIAGTPPAATVVPPSAGRRIPIRLEPTHSNGDNQHAPPAAPKGAPAMNGKKLKVQPSATSTPMLRPKTGSHLPPPATQPDKSSPGLPGSAMLPDVMASGRPVAPEAENQVDGVQQQVNRLRPKTLTMQLRFLYTLVFALWLFGRLVFWQVYVAKWFPDWVQRRNQPRWQKYAREFRYFALRMGGVMIKAGQFASTRADILPEAVIAELVSLQDEVPTIPFDRIWTVLLRELGNIPERFEFITPEPIAAASLGQVHRAQLKNGDKVVVKVQRPGIRDIVYTDMAALFIVAQVAMRFRFISRRADAVALIDEFGRVLLEEISYTTEAQHAERFKQMYAEDMGVYIPTVYREHSTEFVLTIEDVTTLKINDYEGLAAAGIDRKDVAKRLMDTYMHQIFAERFFHADPHPGNLFIYPLPVDNVEQYSGKGGRPFYLIFIDFGMTGTLTREIVQALINTLTATITRDARKLVRSYQDLGFLLPSADVRRIEEATEVVFKQVWGMSMTDMTSIDFNVVQNIGREFNDLLFDMPFRVPQDFIYLGRTVGILTGMATALDPEFNPWTEIQRHMQTLITQDAETNIFEEIGKSLTEPFQALFAGDLQGFLMGMQHLVQRFQRPNKAEMLLEQLVNGDAAVVMKLNPQARRQFERIELQGQRTTRAILFATFMLTGTLLYTNGDIQLAGFAYVTAVILLVSMVFIRQ